MNTYTISIGTFSIKVRSNPANEKSQKDITIEINWSSLHKAWQAAEVHTVATLRDLLIYYEQRSIQKRKLAMAIYPKHSILCEKRCCNKPFSSYYRFLKKELKWDV